MYMDDGYGAPLAKSSLLIRATHLHWWKNIFACMSSEDPQNISSHPACQQIGLNKNPGKIRRHLHDILMHNYQKSSVHIRNDITEAAHPSTSELGRFLL